MVDVSANATSPMTVAGVVGHVSPGKQPVVADTLKASFAAALIDAAPQPAAPAAPAISNAPLPADHTGERPAGLPSGLPEEAMIDAALPVVLAAAKPGKALPLVAARQGLAAAQRPAASQSKVETEAVDPAGPASLVPPAVPEETVPMIADLPVAGETAARLASQILSAPLPTQPGRAAAVRQDSRSGAAPVAATTIRPFRQSAPGMELARQVPSPRTDAPVLPALKLELEITPAAGRAPLRPAPMVTAIAPDAGNPGMSLANAAAPVATPLPVLPSSSIGPGSDSAAETARPAITGAVARLPTASIETTVRAAPPSDVGERPSLPNARPGAASTGSVSAQADAPKEAASVEQPRVDQAFLPGSAAPSHASASVETMRGPSGPALQRVDVATLVDTIARARDEAASIAPVAVALTHAEFGKVSLRFRNEDDGLSVSMSSADPAFAPAVAAAGQAVATADTRQQQGGSPQHDTPRAEAQVRAGDARGEIGASAGGASGQSAANGGARQDNGRTTSTQHARGNARSSGESAQPRDGIFA